MILSSWICLAWRSYKSCSCLRLDSFGFFLVLPNLEDEAVLRLDSTFVLYQSLVLPASCPVVKLAKSLEVTRH